MGFEWRLRRGEPATARIELVARTVQSDEVDIQRTMSVFCHAVGRGAADVWADCFTEDGIYRVRHANGVLRETAGHCALNEYSAGHEGPPEVCLKHMTMATVIDVDGDSATAIAMFAV